jgi:hypothetical protein
MAPKFDITVHHIGEDGAAILSVDRIVNALGKAGATPADIDAFLAETKLCPDYDSLLSVCLRWVNIE